MDRLFTNLSDRLELVQMRKYAIFVSFLSAAAVYGQAAELPDRALGADDLISVSVYGSPELTRSFRISEAGRLRLPMLAEEIPASGVTTARLEIAIAAALKRERLLIDPVVSVAVVEYASRPVTVMGAVRRPLTFQATGVVTLLDALARAEGLSPEAGTEILFTRSKTAPAEHIAVRRLIGAKSPELNPRLFGGEEIRVPEAGRVFIVGNVKRPGAFLVKDPGDASILKVLSQAEGLSPYAQPLAYIYRRDAVSGKTNEISVPIKKIMERKAPDQLLEAEDVLYVPDAKGRRLTAGALDRIVTFGASSASVLMWRR
jgi:polysaccharide export outer membrane protein